jgi:hypothetical protein
MRRRLRGRLWVCLLGIAHDCPLETSVVRIERLVRDVRSVRGERVVRGERGVRGERVAGKEETVEFAQIAHRFRVVAISIAISLSLE